MRATYEMLIFILVYVSGVLEKYFDVAGTKLQPLTFYDTLATLTSVIHRKPDVVISYRRFLCHCIMFLFVSVITPFLV